MTADSLARLAADFEAGTLPRDQWTHLAHLCVGAWHVQHHGAAAALPLLRERIRRLNDRHGTVNSAASGYHETITAAYVTLIADFLASCGPQTALDARIDRLLASPLAKRNVLLRYWSRETLMSSAARAAWVEPDRAPLPAVRV